MVETEVAYEMTRRIVRNEGIFVGMSSGAAMYATIEIASQIESGDEQIDYSDKNLTLS